nr:EOG090X078K [Eulimnadia texana]
MANRPDTETGPNEQKDSAEQDIPGSSSESAGNQQPSSSGGSIFSSAKLSSSSGNGNPFAVRVTPSRPGESSDSSSQSLLAPSKLAAAAAAAASGTAAPGSPFSSNENKSKLVLRPSALSSQAPKSPNGATGSGSILKPATLVNPFAKPVETSEGVEESVSEKLQQSEDNQLTEASESVSGSTFTSSLLAPSRLGVPAGSNSASGSSPASISDTTAPAAASEDGNDSGSSLSTPFAFQPSGSLFSAAASRADPAKAFSTASFVFGQNLHERVVVADGASAASETSSAASSSPNLFSLAEKAEGEAGAPAVNGAAKTLTESAREIEARASKRKYDEVVVVTGEEDEQNALQMNAKLNIFDKVQGWVERGRGTLRLNDKHGENQTLQSRLIMRTQGSLKVILNTKVWAEMTVDKASAKSLRMTAMDGDQIRVFLVSGSMKDTDTLFNALEWRLATLRSQQSRNASDTLPATVDEDPEDPKKRRSE